MNFYRLVGYFSGLLFIKPAMDASVLWRTAALVHFLDAILCCVVAKYGGRSKALWTVAGAICGIWALAVVFLLPEKNDLKNSPSSEEQIKTFK